MGLSGEGSSVLPEKASKLSYSDSVPQHRTSDQKQNRKSSKSQLQAPSSTFIEEDEISDGSVYSDAEEDEKDYCKGGYHRVRIGDKFNDGKYVVLKKLGWGHFSTVWLCEDTVHHRKVAIKIVKSARHYTETALDEIELLQKINKANPNSPGRKYVVELYDNFMHRGPNGTHVCMVFEVLGENLLSLIRKFHHQGIPVHLVKQISYQILAGLDYLHQECGIIHTDLKPENVLVVADLNDILKKLGLVDKSNQHAEKFALAGVKGMNKNEGLPSSMKLRSMKSSDPSSSCALSTTSTTFTTTTSVQSLSHSKSYAPTRPRPPPPRSHHHHYDISLSPNIPSPSKHLHRNFSDISIQEPRVSPKTNKSKPSFSHANDRKKSKVPPLLSVIDVKIADLGNACWVDHHFTNDIQTRQYRSPEVILGAEWNCSTDLWSMGCMVFELLTGDYLFDPKPGKKFSKDDDHIAQMVELLGDFPKQFALSGKKSNEIFNRRGELRRIQNLRYWSLPDVLHDKYNLSSLEARILADFILPMIRVMPSHRSSAKEMMSNLYVEGWDCDSREHSLRLIGLDLPGLERVANALEQGRSLSANDGLVSSQMEPESQKDTGVRKVAGLVGDERSNYNHENATSKFSLSPPTPTVGPSNPTAKSADGVNRSISRQNQPSSSAGSPPLTASNLSKSSEAGTHSSKKSSTFHTSSTSSSSSADSSSPSSSRQSLKVVKTEGNLPFSGIPKPSNRKSALITNDVPTKLQPISRSSIPNPIESKIPLSSTSVASHTSSKQLS